MGAKLNAFAISCYMIILNIKRPDKVSNAATTHPPNQRSDWHYSSTIYGKSTVISRQLKFLGHILRMENDETANIYALFEPLTGEYPRGDGINPFPAKSRNGSTSILRGWRRTHCSRPSQLEANCSFSF